MNKTIIPSEQKKQESDGNEGFLERHVPLIMAGVGLLSALIGGVMLMLIMFSREI